MCKEFTKYCSMYSIDQRTAFNKKGLKYTSVCRANQPAHTKLGTNYTRNMGTASSPWVQNSISRKSKATTGTSRNTCTLVCRTGKTSNRENDRIDPLNYSQSHQKDSRLRSGNKEPSSCDSPSMKNPTLVSMFWS